MIIIIILHINEALNSETSKGDDGPKHPSTRSKKPLPFFASVQHAKNSQLVIQCDECNMWRVAYSKYCLIIDQHKKLQIIIHFYTCGSKVRGPRRTEGIWGWWNIGPWMIVMIQSSVFTILLSTTPFAFMALWASHRSTILQSTRINHLQVKNFVPCVFQWLTQSQTYFLVASLFFLKKRWKFNLISSKMLIFMVCLAANSILARLVNTQDDDAIQH